MQRLTRRFTYAELPWQEAQRAGLLWSPVRKPHENAATRTGCPAGRSRTSRTPSSADLPLPGEQVDLDARVVADRTAGALLGEDDAARDGWLPSDNSGSSRTSGGVSARGSIARRRPVADGPAAAACPPRRRSRSTACAILDFSWFLASAGATRFLAALGAESSKWSGRPTPIRPGSLALPAGEQRGPPRPPAGGAEGPVHGRPVQQQEPGQARHLAECRATREGLPSPRRCWRAATWSPRDSRPASWSAGGSATRRSRRSGPTIIYVQQSGMGTFGTYGRFRAVGPIAAAFRACRRCRGCPSPPCRPAGATPTSTGSAPTAWPSVLAALYHRDRTGGASGSTRHRRRRASCSPRCRLDWSANGRPWQRVGNRSPYKEAAPHGIYRCPGDDSWIAIACSTEADWQALADLAGRAPADPRFATVARRAGAPRRARRRPVVVDARVRAVLADASAAGGWRARRACARPPATAATTTRSSRHLGWLTEVTGTQIGRWPLAEVPVRMCARPRTWADAPTAAHRCTARTTRRSSPGCSGCRKRRWPGSPSRASSSRRAGLLLRGFPRDVTPPEHRRRAKGVVPLDAPDGDARAVRGYWPLVVRALLVSSAPVGPVRAGARRTRHPGVIVQVVSMWFRHSWLR